MNWMARGLVLVLCAAPLTGVEAGKGTRVYLRNDARLVQTFEGSVTTFRCEQMGGTKLRVPRWVRDCNALAREEMESMKREGKLGATKIARDPMGEKIVANELVLSMPINPAEDPAHGPVANR